jgi:hypothetical protein
MNSSKVMLLGAFLAKFVSSSSAWHTIMQPVLQMDTMACKHKALL